MYWGTLRERHANELAAAALPKSDGKTAKHVTYKKKPKKIENRRKGWDLCTHIDTPKKDKEIQTKEKYPKNLHLMHLSLADKALGNSINS